MKGYVPDSQRDPTAGCGYCGRHAGDDSHLLGENRHVAEKSVFQDLDDPYSDQ